MAGLITMACSQERSSGAFSARRRSTVVVECRSIISVRPTSNILHAIPRAKRRRVGRTLVSWASHVTWSAPTAHFMYWHQSTMVRPSQMAIRSPQHKCPNQDNGRL